MSHAARRPRYGAAVAGLAMCLALSRVATAQLRIGVGVALPGVRIGINVPAYPNLIPIPGYPVYYAPGLEDNLFFYDGLYWVYTLESWYYSTWYDGPWYLVQPDWVPVFLLRIPILYYRRPPPYFLRWNRYGPPRWGEQWGPDWERRRSGWDRWDRAAVPPRAPLPTYQRQYPRTRYPDLDRQRNLESRYYRYTPRSIRPGPGGTPPRGAPGREPGRTPFERRPQGERGRAPAARPGERSRPPQPRSKGRRPPEPQPSERRGQQDTGRAQRD